ncbi:MAG: hypothetical protein C0443_06950 [Comamonadaceae bacterium]|nr:hypothetical protein [Comamonadaceae bacterium]
MPLEENKVVLVVDLVESVRLMAAHEAAVVDHWHRFMRHARTVVLPQWRGRLVKSLGDGLLAEFNRASDAVCAALALHRFFQPVNADLPEPQRLYLRAGLNGTHLYVDVGDVYGHGVNLAARLASLGGPGETVVTANVCDGIIDGVDGVLEDMGESYLKHWPEPVRTWRVWPADSAGAAVPKVSLPPAQEDLRPTIAVIPLDCRGGQDEHQVIGELIADGVIAQLSRSRQMRVISRLSTTAFRGRGAQLSEIQAHLGSGYVLSGNYSMAGDRLVVMAELSDARRSDVVWADRVVGSIADLLQADSQLIRELTDRASEALLDDTVQRATVLPCPQLDSNALLLGGIALMHRSTARDLDRSRELLDAVTERHRRVATPWAWMAKWHILNIIQGRSPDAPTEFREAIQIADRALDLEPHSSLALAIKGHVQCHLGTQLDESRQLLLQATEVNPNDHNAWLYAGFWSTMWGDPADAVRESEKALELSPLDPQRFFIEMLVAHSYFAGNQLDKAVALCNQSLKRNRYYLATLRVLMASLHELGRDEEARTVFQSLHQLQPDMTIARFLGYGSSCLARQRVASAMRAMGVP